MEEGRRIDRRVVRTRKAIQDEFIRLLKKKDFESITVSDIVEGVNINRSTFYLHYKDKYDLLEKMQAECLDNLARKLEECRSEIPSSATAEEEVQAFYNYVVSYVTLFRDQSELMMLFLNMSGEFDFKSKLQSLLWDNLKNDRFPSMQTANSKIPFQYIYAHMSGSGIGLLLTWLNGGCKETPEELADILMELNTAGVYNLLSKES
ncbi:MAG: TetR/AcrR family transcriptional regulator [Clostridiales bacterium]|nr:TetR/AcrR family transcriptional regulator [Clostridiales bacterium]